MENKREFVSGVVEGFYGRPWTSLQRKKLFIRLKSMGLNTYLYAPKDDLKHRQNWRELYNESEILQIKILIDGCKQQDIQFVYAISPGLDITFSSPADLFLLKQKMEQVLTLGCDAFSLLFDDIDPNLNNVDKLMFHTFAYAQATVTNDIFNLLNKPSFFLFCPTEYCATRAIPSVQKSEYLQTIGKILLPEIDVMWTGPKVISETITLESILELSEILKRPPVLWDNIHANDYDQRRVYLGPYSGRPSELIKHIRGVLLNPNCEFEANYIAIHTLAHWIKSDELYSSSRALDFALIDWMKLLYIKENVEELPTTSKDSAMRNSDEKVTFQIENVSRKDSINFSLQESSNSALKNIDQPNVAADSPKPLHSKFTVKSDIKESVCELSNKTKVISPIKSNSASKESENGTDLIKIINNRNITSYDYKMCRNESSNEMELVSKVEEASECSDSHNQMILDSIVNAFPLTPMETEDNQTDTDNVTDSMAMQIDNIYESTFEKMDIIDDMENNNNLQRKKTKELISSKNKSKQLENISSIDSSKLTLDDLHLLVNMFYLPYQYGPRAVEMLNSINWLRSHEFYVREDIRNSAETVSNSSGHSSNFNENERIYERKIRSYWKEKAEKFSFQYDKVRCMADRFTNIPNRSILYDLYPYLQDMRHVLCNLNSYVKWIGCLPGYNVSLMNDDHEPWVFRGGLIGEFQRMFPLEGTFDLFPNEVRFIENEPNLPKLLTKADSELKSEDNENCQCINEIPSPENCQAIYIIQPYHSSDRKQLYKLCQEILYKQFFEDPALDKQKLAALTTDDRFKDLPGDRYIGVFLDFSPDNCMILEDNNERICGYALGTIQVKEFIKFRQRDYNSKMRKKYEFYLSDSNNQVTSSTNGDEISTSFPTSNKNSIIENLINGFGESNLDKTLDMFDNSTHALIHVDMSDVCKKSNILHINSVGFRLIKSISSALKKKILQTSMSNSQLEDNYYNEDYVESEDPLSDTSDQITSNSQPSCTSLSLAIFSEVDSLNKRHEKFYKRHGFELCNVDRQMNNVMIMSRYI